MTGLRYKLIYGLDPVWYDVIAFMDHFLEAKPPLTEIQTTTE
jgi:hypothetical protein